MIDIKSVDLINPSWSWLNNQESVIQQIVNSPKNVIIYEGEPGSGKSIIGIAAGRLLASPDGKFLILAQTRNLQRQYLRDFPKLRLIEGRSHYTCLINQDSTDHAPCVIGYACPYKGKFDHVSKKWVEWPECSYYHDKAVASLAPATVPNYAYWLTESKHVGLFSSVDVIVCDEAHLLDNILMASAVIEINKESARRLALAIDRNRALEWSYWNDWLPRAYDRALAQSELLADRAREKGITLPPLNKNGTIISDEPSIVPIGNSHNPYLDDVGTSDADPMIIPDISLSQLITDYKHIKALYDSVSDALGTVHSATNQRNNEWVIDQDTKSVYFKPLYGKPGFQRMQRSARKKIILMSAYLAPEMLMRTLGLSKDDCEVIVGDEVYDRRDSQIYYCPTLKLSHKTSVREWDKVINIIDQFIGLYYPEKGYIQVPSLELRDRILERSSYSHIMVTYESSARGGGSSALDLDAAVEKFTNSNHQAVLLGQSIGTGLDIPYIPTWQIIPKMPYPSLADRQVKARSDVDKSYYPYQVITHLVQYFGRMKRRTDDRGDTVILDANFGWFFSQHKRSFSQWVLKALVWDGWKSFPTIRH